MVFFNLNDIHVVIIDINHQLTSFYILLSFKMPL